MSNYTETTHTGWFGRIKNAFGGLIFGLILTIGAVVLLFWNEGRSVDRYKTLKEGKEAVVSVAADQIEPANEGKLVHVSGVTEVKSGPLSDVVFGVSQDGVKLRRNAEMYQWKQNESSKTKKKVGGGASETKSYSYSKQWASKLINSSEFEQPGRDNPKSMPYPSDTITAKNVNVGAFTMPDFLVKKINKSEPVVIESLENANPKVKETGKLTSEGVYFGTNQDDPQIGDQKVDFTVVPTGPVTTVAQQQGNTFVVYKAEHGTIQFLEEDTKTADEMFVAANTREKLMAWAIRGGGFALMAFGIGLLFKPLSVLADVIPILGNIVGAGAGFLATILAGIISFLTIAIAWIFYRPVLGVSLLVIAVVLLVLLIKRIGSKKAGAAQSQAGYAGPTSAPPPLD